MTTQRHRLPPETTPAPTAASLFGPAMTPVPQTQPKPQPQPSSTSSQAKFPPSTDCNTCTKHGHGKDDEEPDIGFPIPKLRLEIRDLSHAGASVFLSSVHTTRCMTTAIRRLLRLLYVSPESRTTTAPPTRSVTLILRSMPGVAYTTGSDLDNDHKEIHFSLDYISGISAKEEDKSKASRRRFEEITGVITHELVHCYQWNGKGTCPGGLVEGIADWVRLNCDLSPPHWKRDAGGKWDGGYQHTAYFLEYLEGRFGEGTVRKINEKLRIQRYEEKAFWTELLGRPVEQLWEDYGKKLKDDEVVIVEKEEASGEESMTTATRTKVS